MEMRLRSGRVALAVGQVMLTNPQIWQRRVAAFRRETSAYTSFAVNHRRDDVLLVATDCARGKKSTHHHHPSGLFRVPTMRVRSDRKVAQESGCCRNEHKPSVRRRDTSFRTCRMVG